MTKLEEWLEYKTRNLICLVPREDAESVITCHERTLCDCEILKFKAVIEKLKAALESLAHQNGNEFAMQSEAQEALEINPEKL